MKRKILQQRKEKSIKSFPAHLAILVNPGKGERSTISESSILPPREGKSKKEHRGIIKAHARCALFTPLSFSISDSRGRGGG